MPQAFLTPNASLERSNPAPDKVKSRKHKCLRDFTWLELGHGNITFSEELDFDPEELDIVYADNDTEASQ